MDAKLLQDVQRLMSGRTPAQALLDRAPVLRWWQVRRCGDGLQLVGTQQFHPPGPRSIMESTGALIWMDPDLRWCRCTHRWWRLGEYETEIPMDWDGF